MSETTNLRTGLADRIRAHIVAGTLAPGSRVNESQLSRELEVSRTPLREALMAIERTGLLTSSPQRGFFVTPLSVREVRELYPIGRALDRLALESAGPVPLAAIEALAKLNKRFAAARNRPESARRIDRDFHTTLTARCPNRRLLALLEDVQASMERYERVYMADPLGIDRSVRQHDEVIAALRDDDLEAAIRVFERQWDDSLRHLTRALGEQA